MFLKSCWTVGLVLVAFGAASAQDPTKVEPSHYKLAFENETVQVVDVHYGPHEKSRMHDHPGGVVVVIHGGHLRFTDPEGKVREVFSKAGESRWFPPFKHEVENVGDTSYDAVYVGMKIKRTTANARPAGQPAPMDAGSVKVLAEAIASARMKASVR
jgi:quercetin dioxygenase-like cupin family protein